VKTDSGTKNEHVIVWDFSGQERFREIQEDFLTGTHGVMYVFSSYRGLYELDKWEAFVKKINPNAPWMLIQTKLDLEDYYIDTRNVEEIINYLDCPYYETSAKDGCNLDLIFTDMTQLMYDFSQKVPVFPKSKVISDLALNSKSQKEKRKQLKDFIRTLELQQQKMIGDVRDFELQLAREHATEESEYEWICEHCGMHNISISQNCLECGNNPPRTSKFWFCQDCGHMNFYPTKICENCGSSIRYLGKN
jgi:hypothetical protein